MAWKMQQGSAPCKDDKPKGAEILPFQAGSDYSLSAKPALCRLDYAMSKAGGTTDFVRKHTLAAGGPYCDCGYVKKDAARSHPKHFSSN